MKTKRQSSLKILLLYILPSIFLGITYIPITDFPWPPSPTLITDLSFSLIFHPLYADFHYTLIKIHRLTRQLTFFLSRMQQHLVGIFYEVSDDDMHIVHNIIMQLLVALGDYKNMVREKLDIREWNWRHGILQGNSQLLEVFRTMTNKLELQIKVHQNNLKNLEQVHKKKQKNKRRKQPAKRPKPSQTTQIAQTPSTSQTFDTPQTLSRPHYEQEQAQGSQPKMSKPMSSQQQSGLVSIVIPFPRQRYQQYEEPSTSASGFYAYYPPRQPISYVTPPSMSQLMSDPEPIASTSGWTMPTLPQAAQPQAHMGPQTDPLEVKTPKQSTTSDSQPEDTSSSLPLDLRKPFDKHTLDEYTFTNNEKSKFLLSCYLHDFTQDSNALKLSSLLTLEQAQFQQVRRIFLLIYKQLNQLVSMHTKFQTQLKFKNPPTDKRKQLLKKCNILETAIKIILKMMGFHKGFLIMLSALLTKKEVTIASMCLKKQMPQLQNQFDKLKQQVKLLFNGINKLSVEHISEYVHQKNIIEIPKYRRGPQVPIQSHIHCAIMNLYLEDRMTKLSQSNKVKISSDFVNSLGDPKSLKWYMASKYMYIVKQEVNIQLQRRKGKKIMKKIKNSVKQHAVLELSHQFVLYMIIRSENIKKLQKVIEEYRTILKALVIKKKRVDQLVEKQKDMQQSVEKFVQRLKALVSQCEQLLKNVYKTTEYCSPAECQ